MEIKIEINDLKINAYLNGSMLFTGKCSSICFVRYITTLYEALPERNKDTKWNNSFNIKYLFPFASYFNVSCVGRINNKNDCYIEDLSIY